MLPFALSFARETRLSDDRIHAILRAGEDPHVRAADLCGQHGITIPQFCVLKKKYGALSLDELRAARAAEARRRTRVLTAAGLVLALTATVGVALFIVPSSTVARAGAAGVADGQSSAPSEATPAPPAQPRVAPTPRVAAPVLRPGPEPSERPVAGDDGYAVQVAAVPDAESGRKMVDRLALSGFAAYLRPAPAGTDAAFRVRVGPYRTRRQAELTLQDLVHAGYAEAWLTR